MDHDKEDLIPMLPNSDGRLCSFFSSLGPSMDLGLSRPISRENKVQSGFAKTVDAPNKRTVMFYDLFCLPT